MLLEELIDIVTLMCVDDDSAAEDVVPLLATYLVLEQIRAAAEYSLRVNRLFILAICHDRKCLPTKIEFFYRYDYIIY